MRRYQPCSTMAGILIFGTLACGIPQEEHAAALADQKASLNAEMKKAQDEHAKALSDKDSKIEVLKGDVGLLTKNLENVTTKLDALDEKLGVKSIELVTAKAAVTTAQERLTETDAVLKKKEENLKAADKELKATKDELVQVRKLREKAEVAAKSFKGLAQRLKSMVDSGKLEVITRNGRMTVKLPDDILFQQGRQRLKKAGRKAITEVAKILAEVKDRDFLIAGHTDNIPIKKGRYKSNWDLSTARAVEVVKLMIKSGVPAKHLAAAGYGEFDPAADNSTREGRSKNRRLEIVLMPNLDELPAVPE